MFLQFWLWEIRPTVWYAGERGASLGIHPSSAGRERFVLPTWEVQCYHTNHTDPLLAKKKKNNHAWVKPKTHWLHHCRIWTVRTLNAKLFLIFLLRWPLLWIEIRDNHMKNREQHFKGFQGNTCSLIMRFSHKYMLLLPSNTQLNEN